MNKITCASIWIIVALAVILTGCTNSADQLTAQSQNANDNVEILQVSWAHAFTLEDLVWGADLIIVGTIAGIQETRVENRIENIFAGNIYTDYKVDVSKVLKTYPGFTDRSVIVKHQGGTYQGRTQVVSEDEPYQIGQKVILFLRDISIFPGQTRLGEKKYSVLMPGGRFHIKQDGKLDTPTQHLAVAEVYRGKDIATVEKDVLSRLPAISDYLQREVEGSFLIVEGTVGQVLKTYMNADVTPQEMAQSKARGELPDLVYTFYAFTVDKVLEDKLVGAKDYPHKTALYKGAPVSGGNVITVLQMGGTYEGITQRRTLVPFLKPGDKMLLFLGAIGCGEGSPLCTKAEQEANKVLYMLGDLSDRFLVGSDNRLTTLTPGPVSRFYNGQAKSRLEQDIAAAKVNWEKALEELKKRPIPIPPPFPTPVPPTRQP